MLTGERRPMYPYGPDAQTQQQPPMPYLNQTRLSSIPKHVTSNFNSDGSPILHPRPHSRTASIHGHVSNGMNARQTLPPVTSTPAIPVIPFSPATVLSNSPPSAGPVPQSSEPFVPVIDLHLLERRASDLHSNGDRCVGEVRMQLPSPPISTRAITSLNLSLAMEDEFKPDFLDEDKNKQPTNMTVGCGPIPPLSPQHGQQQQQSMEIHAPSTPGFNSRDLRQSSGPLLSSGRLAHLNTSSPIMSSRRVLINQDVLSRESTASGGLSRDSSMNDFELESLPSFGSPVVAPTPAPNSPSPSFTCHGGLDSSPLQAVRRLNGGKQLQANRRTTWNQEGPQTIVTQSLRTTSSATSSYNSGCSTGNSHIGLTSSSSFSFGSTRSSIGVNMEDANIHPIEAGMQKLGIRA